jgi:hypothetical protein
MNRFLFVALTLSMLAVNPAAYADGWHGNDNGNGHGRPVWHGHPPAYHPAPYRPYYPYAYPQHKNNNNHTEWPAYVVGGLVLGALLTNAFPGSRPAAYSAQSSPPINEDSGRHLLRDVDGNCYERQTDGAGNEMRTQLPASACNW